MRERQIFDTTGDAGTLAGEVYSDLRQKIIAGGLAPGSRLSPAALAASYGVSSTVIREALTRLASERLAQSLPQQGYSVANATKDELVDLAKVRMVIDAEALRLSILRDNLAWKGAVVSAHYMLVEASRVSGTDEGGVENFHELHHSFHATLISGCESPRLIALSKQLYYESEIYRRRYRPIIPQTAQRAAKEHDAIVQAALGGNATEACRLLISHFQSSINELVEFGLLDSAELRQLTGQHALQVESSASDVPGKRRAGRQRREPAKIPAVGKRARALTSS